MTVSFRVEGMGGMFTAPTEDMAKEVMARLAKRVGDNSKKRVRAQTDLTGNAFTPRKSKQRKKMLTKIGQRITTIKVTADSAVIGFRNPVTGQIAAKHQFGDTRIVTVEDVKRQPGQLQPSAPATKRQATALLEAGFKIRRPKGGYKTPTKKWITGINPESGKPNITLGQAGLVLRVLRVAAKKQWSMVLPARSFLGVQDSELAELGDLAKQEILKAMRL